jgi:cullin 1
LLAQPEGAKPESGTTYKLNTGFKTKKVKMNLNIGIKSEQKAEAEDTHKTIEEDRKLLMQVSTRMPLPPEYSLTSFSRPLCVS